MIAKENQIKHPLKNWFIMYNIMSVTTAHAKIDI